MLWRSGSSQAKVWSAHGQSSPSFSFPIPNSREVGNGLRSGNASSKSKERQEYLHISKSQSIAGTRQLV